MTSADPRDAAQPVLAQAGAHAAGRTHLTVVTEAGRILVRRAAGGDVAFPCPDGPDGDEAACAAAFAEAALAWLASRASSPTPEGDVSWFATRPGRSHRFRPSLPSEVAGRPQRRWATIVARHGEGLVRLCVDEATLPRSDRGEHDLAALLRARAVAMAVGVATGVGEAPPLPTVARPPRSVPRDRVRDALRHVPTGRPRGRPPTVGSGPSPNAAPKGDAALGTKQPRAVPEASRVPARVPVPTGLGLVGTGGAWQEVLVARANDDAWPCMALPEALHVVRTLRDRHGRLPVRAHDARRACTEVAGVDGAAGMAALKAFGLVMTRADGTLSLTELAREALDEEPDRRWARATAILRAAASPSAYADLMSKARDTSVPDASASPRAALLSDERRRSATEAFARTVEFAAGAA